ncbi:cytochrome P450 [Mycena albidolilacea]|uniref:Cytochrome P450 n=1 Tax=Mycena albidolilacea TaxID=1033008 RepID=A0AAD7APF1_9AGAR|nr:cytochrome P450 [Mycena albidolilacea]
MEGIILVLSAAGGLASWLFFHFIPVRGDHAAVFYAALVLSVYAATWVMDSETSLGLTAAVSGLYTAFTCLFTIIYRISPWHKLANYPGPFLYKISALALVPLSLQGKRNIVFDQLHAQYGDFVRVGPDSLSIKRKSGNTIIYGAGTHMEKTDSYIRPGHPEAVGLFFKLSSRELHAERRRLWSPAFSSAGIANYIPVLEKRTWQLMHCIERRQAHSADGYLDLSQAFCHWAYDFACDTVFGGLVSVEVMKSGDPDLIVDGHKRATVLLDSFGQSPWLTDIAWHLPIAKSQVRLINRLAQMTEKRIQMDSDTTMRDITSYFLDAGAHRPPLEDIKLDTLIAIQAGFESPSTTTSLACYFMLSTENGRQWDKLRDELDAAFPDPLGSLSTDVLAQLPYLNAVINEALRLGLANYVPRSVGKGGVMIDNKYIPEGVNVALAAYSLQRSPENFYPDPLEFRAERWLPGGLGPNSITDKSVLYSFSSGPYACIGKGLAYQEMRMVLARLVLTFNLELASDFDPNAFRKGILNARTTLFKVPLRMRAHRRPGITLLDPQ